MRVAHQTAARTVDSQALRDEALSPMFQAAREATEEAIINSLLKATTVAGHLGRTSEAIPVDKVIDICQRHGVIRARQ